MTRVQAIVEEMVRDEGVTGAVRLGYHDRLLAAHRADLEEALAVPHAGPDDLPTTGREFAIVAAFIASRRKRYIP